MIVLVIHLFAVEIWGTVSDWVMVAVTMGTAYYLYKTLRSQQEVQQTQNELFKIESIRFKESIKPILKYVASTNMMHPVEENKEILTIQVTNNTSSTALDISKIVSGSEQTRQIFIPMGFDNTRTHLTKDDRPILFHFLIDSKSQLSKYVTFNVTYSDIAGTKYKQSVFCICDDQGIELHPYLPEK